MVAMEIDKALECALLAAGEEPVDRSALVGLQMIFEEALREVTANGVTRLLATVGAKTLGHEG
ncbi:MAG: hypothetical protein HC774_07065 [Sphingomonadales bacterium]|nr:hypothetical protein [Sphingomonadales bacterium]